MVGIPVVGIPVVGIPVVGIPVVDIPVVGIPVVGIPARNSNRWAESNLKHPLANRVALLLHKKAETRKKVQLSTFWVMR